MKLDIASLSLHLRTTLPKDYCSIERKDVEVFELFDAIVHRLNDEDTTKQWVEMKRLYQEQKEKCKELEKEAKKMDEEDYIDPCAM